MPPILTLLVGKRLGNSQSSVEDHYNVRDFAGSLLNQVCTNYGDTYHALKPRVTRTLLKAFMDSTKSAGTQYGALSGLTAMGPEIIRVLVLGNLRDWAAVIGSTSTVTEEDKRRLGNAVLDALRLLVDPEFSTIEELSTEDITKFSEFVGLEVAKLVDDAPDKENIIKAVLEGQKFP